MEILLVSCTEMVAINNLFGCFCPECLEIYGPLFEIRMLMIGANNILVYSLHW